MDFHHPLFQSLALPLVLAFVAAGLLRTLLGPGMGARWAAGGVALALLVSAGWTLGWRFPPGPYTEKLPWLYAGAAVAGLVLEATRAPRRVQWGVAALLWIVALVLLGGGPLPLRIGSGVLGVLVIAAVLHEPRARAEAPAMLVVAGIGLALLAMLSGSALLFELALALGAAMAGLTLWLWPVSRIGFGAAGAVVALLAWLALAHGTAVLTTVRPAALVLLAGAFSACALVRALRRRLHRGEAAAWAETLLVAAVAALWVAAALALAHLGGPRAGEGAADDLYYAPKW